MTCDGYSLIALRRALAYVVICLAVAGGAVQAIRLVQFTAASSYHRHPSYPLQKFLAAARARLELGVVYANTSGHAEQIRYGLYPRIQRHVALSGDPDKVRSELAAVHARYVVIADDHETVFDGTSGTWWIELLRQGDFRVIQVQP